MPMVQESELPIEFLDGPPAKITPVQMKALHAKMIAREKQRALTDVKHADRDCTRCGFPIASWRNSCWVCDMMKREIAREFADIDNRYP